MWPRVPFTVEVGIILVDFSHGRLLDIHVDWIVTVAVLADATFAVIHVSQDSSELEHSVVLAE